MDRPRDIDPARRRRRRLAWGAATALALASAGLGLSRLRPAAPPVERSALWIDTVRRGPMVRQVRGPGSLVPEQLQWAAAPVEGRVQRILARAGAPVEAATALVELDSPEVARAALEAESNLRAAEADYADLEARLAGERLRQESQSEQAAGEAERARLQAEADGQLAAQGLVSDLSRRLSALRAEQLARQADLERQRLARAAESAAAQLAANRARRDHLAALAALRREQAAALTVRAGIDGVLQEVAVEVGQRVAAGTVLARVARPDRLKAELRIAETQAKDVAVGLPAEIDTRNGVVSGRVVRVDPAVREGTVTVDVALDGALPRGARPDLSVDGTIQLERLADVLFVGRPAFGQPGSTVGLFRLDEDGEAAVRVPVALGRSSVLTIEVVSGLAAGERVILSDMSAWDGHDRVRLR